MGVPDIPSVFVAGHRGMVGSAIVRRLARDGITAARAARSELDLRDQRAVFDFFERNRFGHVYLAAARVGGIHANNTYPADFIYDNLVVQCNVLEAACRSRVARLLFLGSSCIYPRLAPQPMLEDALMSGPLEPTNEPYAIAKIAGIKMCESYNRQHGCDFRSVMPCNLFGPGDNFHPENSHFLPALIRRFHEAKLAGADEVVVWGTGAPMRELLHVDDLADACVFIMSLSREAYAAATRPQLSHINIGYGSDHTIAEIARMVARVVGFTGAIRFDPSKPDGMPRKLMDSSLAFRLGWRPRIGLEEGLRSTYEWFKSAGDSAIRCR